MESTLESSLNDIAARRSLHREGLSSGIADVLRDAVAYGSFSSGDRLNQDRIAQALGVSRIPVREALNLLVAEGLAVHLPNKGIRVAAMSEEDFLDITELRLMLEPHALRVSAPLLTENDFAAAEALLRKVPAHWGTPEGAALHWRFHQTLYARAPRRRLLAQINALQMAISRYLKAEWIEVGLADGWEACHLDIVTALRRGRVEAAVAMVGDQIEDAAARVLARLREAKEGVE